MSINFLGLLFLFAVCCVLGTCKPFIMTVAIFLAVRSMR